MNELSLSRLYRRLSGARPSPPIDAADMASIAAADSATASSDQRDAVAATIAASTKYSDLTRLLHALKPASQALAQDVNATRRIGAHPTRTRELRPAAGARRGQAQHLRWAGAIAACLAVALGLWSQHTDRSSLIRQSSVTARATKPAAINDRIFTSRDEIFASSSDSPAHPSLKSDELFRADFSGT
jgi:hypothetical protein